MKQNTITKCLWNPNRINKLFEISELYNKKIWIIRDPRDVLISSFFYSWYKGHNPNKDKFEIYLNRIIEKEQSPSDLSWIEITKGLSNPIHYAKSVYIPLINTISLLSKFGWYIFKYEDLLKSNTQGLEKYLSLTFNNERDIHPRLQRVKRSSKMGNWKNYFTKEDVFALKETYAPILKELTYNSNDWELNKSIKLVPEEGSLYMKNIFYN